MRKLLKKIIPIWALKGYHYALARTAQYMYGNPSSKLIVIGVTGTNGKSSTVNILGKLLESEDVKVGFATTANFKIADREWINDTKMTMLGRFALQKMLREMVDAGCTYAVIETSSQGIEQYRHVGINYDTVVFTNLTPEHIEAHGGFENYKKAKGKLFKHLTSQSQKTFRGRVVPKTIVANLDDEHVDYFLSFSADKKIGYTLKDTHTAQVERIYTVEDPQLSRTGITFVFEGTTMQSSLVGEYNIYNTSAAISVALELGIPLEEVSKRVKNITTIPGRMELIDEGQAFSVLVDYAPEPQSLKALYATLQLFEKNRLIHVLGSCGGGRDVARRPVLGEMAAKQADVVIITNEDPYDDDSLGIMYHISEGAEQAGKVRDKDLFLIEDRKEAIQTAIKMAQPGDMVLITGKGCEQFIMSAQGRKIPHDDRDVARRAIRKL